MRPENDLPPLRIVGGRSVIRRVDLARHAKACWRNVETADATLVTDIDAVSRANESRLRQPFENLIRNSVECGGPDVTITVGELDDGFYVGDDGPAIADGTHAAAFEAGYSTSEDGTGFGLSIVEQVVAADGRDIEATPGSGGGARFEITGVEFVAG